MFKICQSARNSANISFYWNHLDSYSCSFPLFLPISLVCDHIAKHGLLKFHLTCRSHLKPPITWHTNTNTTKAVVIQIYSKILSAHCIPSGTYAICHSVVQILIKFSGKDWKVKEWLTGQNRNQGWSCSSGITCRAHCGIPGRTFLEGVDFQVLNSFIIPEIIFLTYLWWPIKYVIWSRVGR